MGRMVDFTKVKLRGGYEYQYVDSLGSKDFPIRGHYRKKPTDEWSGISHGKEGNFLFSEEEDEFDLLEERTEIQCLTRKIVVVSLCCVGIVLATLVLYWEFLFINPYYSFCFLKDVREFMEKMSYLFGFSYF